jgi:hypothetical protein
MIVPSPVKDVTPPGAGVGTYPEIFPLASTCHVISSSPGGAGGVVELRLGDVTKEPLTLSEPPAPYAASISEKFAMITSSIP